MGHVLCMVQTAYEGCLAERVWIYGLILAGGGS